MFTTRSTLNFGKEWIRVTKKYLKSTLFIRQLFLNLFNRSRLGISAVGLPSTQVIIWHIISIAKIKETVSFVRFQ